MPGSFPPTAMSAKSRPAHLRLQAAVEIDAILHKVVGQVDFLIGGEIQHQKKRRIRVGERNVLAVAGHVLGGCMPAGSDSPTARPAAREAQRC